MKRIQLVSPKILARMQQEAQAAFERHDLSDCLEILQRLNRLSPADAAILVRLGWIHGLLYDYASAEKCFEKAIQVAAPDKKAEMLAAAGRQASDFFNTDIAERYLSRAVSEDSATPEMLVKLAEFYERKGRMEEAGVLVTRALEMKPDSGPALFARAHLHARSGKLDEAEHVLRSLVEGRVEREVRIRAGYELGAVLDRNGQYDEAMSALLRTKAVLEGDGERYLAQQRAFMDRMRAMIEQSITADVLRKWYEFGRELQPARQVALLAGHPRSGTTLLEQVLDSHPAIVSAEEASHFEDYARRPLDRRFKEVMPLLDVLESAPKEILLACRRDYFRASEACVGTSLDGRILIDKNPSLTSSIPSLVRVLPEMKFLIALRDPRDVVLSCFMQPMLPIRRVSATWLRLDTAVDEYVGLMGIWRILAPRLSNPYLEVRYEDMVSDLEAVSRQVLEFLAVPWDERVLGFDEHARQKRVRSPTYADVTQKVFTRAMGRWRNYQKYLEPHLAKLEPFVKAFGYD